MSTRRKKKDQSLAQALGALLEQVLVPDLRARARAPAVAAVLKQRWEHARAQERTAEPFGPWVDQTVEQVGAAWILSCVFVRTLEDRGLVARRRLAGEGAADSEHYFNELAPSLNARDYLLTVFRELSRFPGTEELLGPKGNPAWRLTPSGPAAQALLDFFRERKEDGALRWTFGVPAGEAGADTRDGHDTRFLGDLYQDLSASVRERYALLQTPDFVERFILGLTLDPAIREFGLEEVRVIDPTCGSGHFLLGAYDRLFEARLAAKPGLDRRQHALDALAQVYGVDINPYAVAIARFRLTLSYLHKAGIDRLADVPRLPPNLVVADSLLYGARGVTRELGEVAASKEEWGDDLFRLEDPDRAVELLSRGYHAVVGNPPYITCKDARLRRLYAARYGSCAMNYSLAVPFTERFFQLSAEGGFVGMINPNSFAKREFGKPLIEKVLPRFDLQRVIDTSGAFIPGHGTPTVILVARSRDPATPTIHAVLGRRGEPSTPEFAERGRVWSAIAAHYDDAGYEDEFVTVADVPRAAFEAHPWSLGGGGAAELKREIEKKAHRRLGDVVADVGFSAIIGEDEAFLRPAGRAQWAHLPRRPTVIGEGVRDWSLTVETDVLFPFRGADFETHATDALRRELWPLKRVLEERIVSGSTTMKESRRAWYDLRRLSRDKLRTPLSIAFAEVATHNHFVLDRGGKVFNRTAPIIKLPASATEDDHLALLGYLNSSTACFWMKQVCHKKSSASQKHHADPARAAYAFSGTALSKMPIPDLATVPLDAVRELVAAGEQRATILSGEALAQRSGRVTTAAELTRLIADSWRELDDVTRRALYLQEELDWWCYSAFGFCSPSDAEVRLDGGSVPLGGRPFEMDAGYDAGLSERIGTGRRSIDAAAIPEHWRRRHDLLSREGIRLIEAREFKRQWRDTELNVDQAKFRRDLEREALLRSVLDVVEQTVGSSSARVVTIREVTRDLLGGDRGPSLRAISEFMGLEPEHLVREAFDREAVPFLLALYLNNMGQETVRAAWEHTWALQRREDAGETLEEPIPVPPKYDQKDYRDPVFWRLRGKLDVPKERFISYPGAERDDDKSPLIGWAGWDHLQRARALAALYLGRKNQDGWEKERLKPLLAGLLELVPWLQQWHNDPSDDPAKDRAGDAYARFVEEEARGFGFTLGDLRAWRPVEKRRQGRTGAPRRKRAGEPETDGATAETAPADAASRFVWKEGDVTFHKEPPHRRKRKGSEVAE